MDYLYTPGWEPVWVGVLLSGREGSFLAPPGLGMGSDDSKGYLTFMRSLIGVLQSVPKGDSIVLLWVLSAHMGYDSVT